MQYQNPKVEKNLADDEGIERYVYKDSLGFETIGIGRCIAQGKRGLSIDESFYLLRNDIDEVYTSLCVFDWFKNLDEPRQNVIIEMTFNLGLSGVLAFKKMILAIQNKDYSSASSCMLDSRWATQVKNRAQRLAHRMNVGCD